MSLRDTSNHEKANNLSKQRRRGKQSNKQTGELKDKSLLFFVSLW
jgi:hypothetical protein